MIFRLSLILVLVGCAQDRNLDDYQSARRKEQLERIAGVQGTYAGWLDRSDGVRVPMALSLESWSTVRDGDQVSTVAGSLLLGASQDSVSFSGGSYDRISSEVSVRIALADFETADLNGKIEDQGGVKILKGRVRVRSDVATFIVTRGASVEVGGPDAFKVMSASVPGVVVENDRRDLKARIQILESTVTAARRILCALSVRQKSVSATININDHFDLDFPAAEFDTELKKLRGRGVNRFRGVEMTLECGPEGAAWVCMVVVAGAGEGVRYEFANAP